MLHLMHTRTRERTVWYGACFLGPLIDYDNCSQNILMRYTNTRKMSSTGIPMLSTVFSVEISAEEYDRAMALHPEAKGAFLQCARSGRELTSQKLLEEEKIMNMISTKEGVRRLLYTASQVERLFTLPMLDHNE
mmetsp:Transcript_20287/g.41294  ORF Transcript_20287/g.41294 Transcript_20287/m.41294 type:complete len:134 (-) Transcript_20287:12-413(-)